MSLGKVSQKQRWHQNAHISRFARKSSDVYKRQATTYTRLIHSCKDEVLIIILKCSCYPVSYTHLLKTLAYLDIFSYLCTMKKDAIIVLLKEQLQQANACLLYTSRCV